MKLGNDLLEKKFDDIDGKIDILIERCRSFQEENQELKRRLQDLEKELENTTLRETKYLEHEDALDSKVDRLLEKLNAFADK